MPARRLLRSLTILAILFASLSVASPALAIPAEINKSFSPTVIEPGAVSILTIRFFNPNLFPLTNFAVSDGLPSGLFIDATPGVTNDCSATVSAPAGGTSVGISGGTIPPKAGLINGTCAITVRVTSTQQGNLINTIAAGTLTTAELETNSTPASATLTVQNLAAVALSKSFTPNTVVVGQNATLTVNVRNADLLVTLTNVSVTDNLPANVTIAGAPTLANCGPGTASTTATSVTLTGATILPGTTCAISVPVTSSVLGVYTNSIGPNSVTSAQGATNVAPAEATFTVQPLELAKSLTPPSIAAGGVSRLRITLSNRSPVAYTGVNLTDLMPNELTIAAPPIPSTTCGGTVTTTTNSVTLTGGSIPAGTLATPSTCFFEVNVTSVIAGTHTNTIPANTLSIDGLPGVSNGNEPSAPLTVTNPLTGSKSFNPSLIAVGDVSTLTITLNNPTGVAYTGVTVTDPLPAGVDIAALPNTSNTCGGTVTTTANSVTLTGGVIPANGSCSFAVDVTANSAATYNNVIPAGAVTTAQGATNGEPITASLRVEDDLSAINRPVGFKRFTPATITAGATSLLEIEIVAPGGPLTNVAYTDVFPSNITVASIPANPTTGCGAGVVVTAPVGGSTVQVSGASIAGGNSCVVRVNVTSVVQGTHVNSIGIGDVTGTDENDVTVSNVVTIGPAALTVQSLTMSKTFAPDTIGPNGRSTATIQLFNYAPTPLTSLTVTDNLPVGSSTTLGLLVANPANESTTCAGGMVSAIPGASTVTLTGGVIPAQAGGIPGSCTITFDVAPQNHNGPYTSGSATNTVPVENVTNAEEVSPAAPASAVLNFTGVQITVNKDFDPLIVSGGETSVLSVRLINPMAIPIVGAAFTDNMPTGMILASPPGDNTTCGGAVTAASGGATFSFSGGTVPANGSCVITVNVTSLVSGNLTNTIPIGGVTSDTGASNTQPAEASLTYLPGLTLTKVFAPQTILAGGTSVLTLQIANTNPFTITGVNLTDTMPAEITVASPLTTTNTCGGTVSATVGGSSVSLVNGLLTANQTCSFSVVVTSVTGGAHLNSIPASAVQTDQDATNTVPVSDTLTVTSQTLASVGDFVWVDLNANGVQDAGEAGQPGVTVNLFAAGGVTPLATTTTNASGNYLFAGLTPGDYFVEFVLPGGFTFSPLDAGGNDALDSDADTTTGRTATFSLAAGQTNLTRDAGLVGAGTASVGDFVWLDLNANGMQDAGETGQPGVTVNLFAAGGVTPLATTTTNASGNYLFAGLAPGDYFVEFVLPGGFTFSPLDAGGNDALDSDADTTTGRTATFSLAAGQTDLTRDAGLVGASLASLGDFVWLDSNADGIQDAGELGVAGMTVNLFQAGGATPIATDVTDPLGFYRFDNLTPGDYFVEFVLPGGFTFSPLDAGGNDALDSDTDTTTGRTGTISLAGGETDLSVDAGLVGANTVSLGDFVWLDSNADGIQDAGEPGMGGVTVNLFRSDGSPVGTTVTDELGHYLFLNLLPGDYYVEFVLPGGYTFSPLDQGGDDTLDSDADTTTGRTAVVTLVQGSDTTLDAGLVGAPLASLGDFVWEDSNGDGVQGAGEPGVAGVTVRLYTAGGQLVTVTTTNAAGQYAIGNLTPGDYVVEFVLPSGYAFVGPGQGGDPALDSDADTATGRTASITLAGGESNLTVDAGLRRVAVPQNTPVPQVGPAPAISFFDPALSKIGVLEEGALGLPGERLTWLFTISNIGGATGFNIVLTDTLRPELRVDSADTDRGTVSVSGQTVIFSIPSLAPGKSFQARVRTTVLRRPDGGVIENEGVLTGTGSGGEQVQRIATAQITPPGSLPATGYAPQPNLPAGGLALGAAGLVTLLLGGWLVMRRRRSR